MVMRRHIFILFELILNLDGGGSVQFFYNGEMITPGLDNGNFRSIGSVLKIHEK